MALIVAIIAQLTSACVTHRTVTQGGQTVSSGYVYTPLIRH